MLEYSILGKLYNAWQYSFIYSILARVYHFFSREWSESFIRSILAKPSAIQRLYEESLFSHIIDSILGFVLRILAGVCKFFKTAWNHNAIVSFFSQSQILKYDFLFFAFICLMFMIPHSMWSNSYGVLAAFFLLGLYLLLCSIGKKTILAPKHLGFPFMVFVIVTPITMLYTEASRDSFRVLLFFVAAFILMWLVASNVNTPEKLKLLLGIVYVIVIFTALYAIGQRIVGIEINWALIDAELNPNIPARVYSTVENPNNYAELVVLFTPLAAVFAMNIKEVLNRLICCCLLVLPMIALLMTYSRSGWLSIALTVMIFVYYTNKRLIPWVFVAAILCIPFLPESIMTRLGNLVNVKDESAYFRLDLWESCLQLLGMDNRWLTGIGLGPLTYRYNLELVAEQRVAEGMPHTQMLYIELIMEWGIMGFISYMWFICQKIVRGAFAIFKAKDAYVKGALIASISSFLGISILSIFEYIWFYPRILFAHFILLGILISCTMMSAKEY